MSLLITSSSAERPCSTLCTLFEIVQTGVDFCVTRLIELINSLFRHIIHLSVYNNFKTLPEEIILERNLHLTNELGAVTLTCEHTENKHISIQYIKSTADARTGHVLVLCLNTLYEAHHPRHFLPFLKAGIDIVLWNPTEVTPKTYAENLSTILNLLHTEDPTRKIVLKAYCASTDPAISAAARADFPVHLIIDRGHGDIYALAGSYGWLGRTEWIRGLLAAEYACLGIDKIAAVRGNILFLSSEVDQLMDTKKGNLTGQLFKQASEKNSSFKKIPGDHWSEWGITAYQAAFDFLRSIGFITSTENLIESEFPDPSLPDGCVFEHALSDCVKSTC